MPLAADLSVDSFLKMEAVSTAGGSTINYSPRFELAQMTGTFSAAALAEQKKGDRDPPASVDTTVSPNDPPAAAAADAAAKITYTKQTGATRYAPMQTQPGSRITANGGPRRMYPTSSYTVFRGHGLERQRPLVRTTTTMSWDYAVTSLENTASPAPHPHDPASDDADVQRFLGRWRD